MIARANEWSGFDVLEPHRHTDLTHPTELVRRDVTIDRDVRVGRTEVLAQRENVDVDGAKIAHHQLHFLERLAHAENDAGFGRNVRRDALCSAEDLHHALVPATGPTTLVEPRHRLSV